MVLVAISLRCLCRFSDIGPWGLDYRGGEALLGVMLRAWDSCGFWVIIEETTCA